MKDKQLRKDFEDLMIVLFGTKNMDRSFMGMILTFKERLESITPCSTCKALFREEDLQRVEDNSCRHDSSVVCSGRPDILFFCPSPTVPYDRIQDGKYYKDNVEIKIKK